ncbi:MAG: fibronectin/fibrinogen-binding protein [Ruminococcus sp.]|nr:fibronectin/fibrinogen-binding protein [Ruminococcus sp.]
MALDGTFLHLIKQELSVLIDGRVDKIHQPSKEEILIAFRTRNGMSKVIINLSAGTARIHITKAEIENPKVPPMFCMLLRKHLSGAKLIDIRQVGCERVLFFDFDGTNEMGDHVNLTLCVEIMGRHSNLMLINGEGRIIDAIKRVGQDLSSVRPVLPNMVYAMPPRDEDKISLFDIDKEQLSERISLLSEMKLDKGLMRIIEGISPVFAREAEFFATRGEEVSVSELSDDHIDRLAFFLKNCKNEISEGKNTFVTLRTKEGDLKDFCFCNITQYGALMVKKEFESGSELLDYFYTARDLASRMKQRASDLFKLIVTLSERISRRVSNQKQELRECDDREKFKIYGDLIMSNLYRLEKGMSEAEVENFYEEDCPTVKIPLDKRYTPTQNAQKYYNEYRKLDTAKKHLTQLIADGEAEILYIDSVFDLLSRASTESEVIDLRSELAEQGYVKAPRFKGKPPKASPPIKYTSPNGFEILVGRNNKQNDKLTLKDADKSDLWLHTKNIHGSHVIIKCKGVEPDDETILYAAKLAAYHSKGRNSAQVPVDYTQVRFVKKPSGAKPGKVIFTNNKTVYVNPTELENDL